MFEVSGWTGLWAVLVLRMLSTVQGETLTPPYFNLAEGRKITATATCGVDVDTAGPELYCKLVGANAENNVDVQVIQGQFCDVCDPTNPEKMHPPEFAVDGMETWWQSPPLSRSMKYNEVNLTIDLGQEFHVAYVFIRMGNSPRPGLWVLEKSADYGKTYTPWQYFSDSPDDCETYFGKESLAPITKDDSVICTTEYSKIVPLEGGEIPISLLNNRPSANHYFNSTVLQEWTRATNVRMRFLRTKNLLGHLMSVARQDPTVTRRYFYSIKDISIGGRCMCNGHADTCDVQDSENPGILLCRCQHNTCGAKCDSCCPGFEQKKWRQSKVNHPFACERCNCFQHSNTCIYDEEVDRKRLSLDIHGRYDGGGVCQNCQHNTEGINCNKCKPTFYRPYNKEWNETDVCQPCSCNYFYSTGNCYEGSGQCECKTEFTPPRCDSCSFGYFGFPDCRPCECFLNGTMGSQCAANDGQCPCLSNFGGHYCKECAPGYYSFPECKRCECNSEGSVSPTCDQETGNCTCETNFGGKHCNECKDGYYNYPVCSYCSCDISGTKEGICNKETGKCFCKEGYGGEFCDVCLPGYYGYPDCKPCNCSQVGSLGNTCSVLGKCSCLGNYAGKTCDQCSPGYYKYPECLSCECDTYGSNGISCDYEGKCECYHNFAGLRCSSCKEGYYNFPACEDCNCHPAGVVAGFAGCGSVPAGELCQCKDRVEGRICNKCRSLYWNLNTNNPEGCEECNCNIPGVLGGIAVCNSDSGDCVCKSLVVGRGCTECADGTYSLQQDNLFGCSDCECDIGGSVNNVCDKKTGQCFCQERVTGRTCKEPIALHYFPTLYQYQYEAEDGHTPANTLVRYANDENVFANYSWKGYAVFSLLQNKILQDIYVRKPSLYRMVLRYVNNNNAPVIGTIKITPDNPNDNEQEFKVNFKNTSAPAFVTVSGVSGIIPSPFVMNPGPWQISIEINKNLLLDYFVLLPEDFYLASILNQKIEKPCTIDAMGLCRDYTYLNLSQYHITYGGGGYIQTGGKIERLKEYFQDIEHLSKINVIENRVPLLNLAQPNLSFNVTVNKPGQYVVVINYVTPIGDQRTYNVTAVVLSGRHTNSGKVILYSCSYTTMCRQVITTKDGIVAVQQVDGNEIKVDLQSSNANVGIHSVVAIPIEEWSLDFIKPKSVCIKKDGKCIPSSFRNPPETKKVQFEESNVAQSITMLNATYLSLNPDYNTIDLKGKVPTPGYYTFVVHYYQPNFHDFDVIVLMQNGQFYEAILPLRYCPSLSGCRSVIVQDDGNTKFLLTENFMLTLKEQEDKDVYLDYLLVIPTDFYYDRYLEEEDVDRTGEFIATCGSNHFNVDTTVEGFCRDSVFTITAGHNGGALKCDCDYGGSLSFTCDKFGGQCQCKPNIIGRRCEACKTGYYGFPDCKPCNCPSTAYCEPNTGQCICPKHVTGERCDQCQPLTYGFDPIIGCEECNCHSLGIKHSLQCDLFNGSCECQGNIGGRQCDVCLPGHYAFPYCEYCDCDTRGTSGKICDQVTSECFCKKNVVGPKCELCREGSFNLQDINEDGCTECFCFGKTTRCSSSKLIRSQVLEMADWHLVGLNTSTKLEVLPLNLTAQRVGRDSVGVEFGSTEVTNVTVYFSAPNNYTGKKLAAYGGILNYTIFYTIGSTGSAVNEPDVILQGRKTYLVYSSYEQPPPSLLYTASVQLVESNFELPTGSPAKRDHIMEVLEDLQGLYIRASYWTVSVTTSLINVTQDDAVPYQLYTGDDQNLAFALSVEECRCPVNYQGLSCEECAPGFYRVQSGPHGGYCVACQCHGHASECDVNTGVCINCTHNTRGDHCELCEVGYHGNALAGTPGDCLICACPLPVASNNFASACDVSADGEKISCDCNEGYFGARCQSCAAGYFGRPEILGEYCRPCQCSGNINADDPSSCDTVSGDCLRCLNNTFGKACALCAPGFYGDAVGAKDCQSCICDKTGMDYCNSYTGDCVCKPNVTGEKCDRCVVDHYGFQFGKGCKSCDCSEASDSTQCDDVTGQCRCKPGVTGRSCDRCAAGYWNFTADGCVSCGCKSEYSLGLGCNALTGQCECLQGVIGEKCDQCPHRWVFVQDYGCHQCDSCTHALLNNTDELGALIRPVILEFDSTSSGYFTRKKLENMQALLKELEPRFDRVDPKYIILDSYIQELESLEQDSKNLNRKANYSLENSESLQTNAENSKEKAEELFDDLLNAEEESIRVIDGIDKISFQLNEEDGPETDSAVLEGQQILKAMKEYNLTAREIAAKKETEKVDALLKNVTNFRNPVDNLDNATSNLKNALKNFNDKLDDLYNQTQYSLNKANEAQRIIDKSGKERLKKKLSDIENQTMESENNLIVSQTFNENSTQFINKAHEKLDAMQQLFEDLGVHNSEFQTLLDANDFEIEEGEKLKPRVEEHAKNLTERAMKLDSLLTETRDLSSNAVMAAKAYADIVSAVKDAENASLSALRDANRAVDLLSGMENRVFTTEQNSSQALEEAFALSRATNDELKPTLDAALRNYIPIKEDSNQNKQKLDEIEKILKNIQNQSYDKKYAEASNKADDAVRHISSIDDIAKETFSKLKNETEEARLLPKHVDDMRRDLKQTESQLNFVKDKLPTIIEALDEIPKQQSRLQQTADNIEDALEKLNQKIILARDVANQIKIGMKFYPNTTLELKNPSNLEDLSTSTRISGYFKTKKPNGLVWYLGNPPNTRLRKTRTDDYMALIIQNGYPVLKLDIGNGLQTIINNKYVSDDVWYQFIVERTGHNAKLSIREELPGGKEKITTEEKPLEGPLSIFNLDKDKSKLFVGSYQVNYEMQKEIQFSSFDGEIEDLVIGDKPVSLWNFVHGYENHGCKERDKLVNLQPSTGFRFNGNGYVTVNAQSYALRSRSDIQLSFKTFATEGLLFLAGRGKTFTALELRNGKVLYQYNLGGGTKVWHTSKTYNDGNWHSVKASRDGPNGRFTVDGEDIQDLTAPVSGTSVELIETISFGGYPKKHGYIDVTDIKFDGCIDNVVIMGSPLDLREHLRAYDVIGGCPAKFAQTVSFDPHRPGFIAHDGLSVADDFMITLKFKTKAKDGLIFYATDQLQTASISLAMKDGHLKLISQKIDLLSKDSYNDSEWHVVSVLHNNRELTMIMDDYENNTVIDTPPPPLHFLHGTLYIGGLPKKIVLTPGTVGSDLPFEGCIGDLTLKGNVINFANSSNKHNEILGKCILDEVVGIIDTEPTLPTLEPVMPPIDDSRDKTTTSSYDISTTLRGDGGLDFANTDKTEEITTTERLTPPPPPAITNGSVGRPTPTTPKPTPEEGCVLPLEPSQVGPGIYRFGAQKDSRLEYISLRGKYKRQFDFVLEFKSDSDSGIIFYIANETHNEYISAFLQDGYVVYTYSNGRNNAVIKSDRNNFNDSSWHLLEFSRDGGRGKLVIDGSSVFSDTAGDIEEVRVKPPMYIGGLDPDHYNEVLGNLNVTTPFKGCIRKVSMNNKPLERATEFAVVPCFNKVESGTFFPLSGNSYVRLREPRFRIGEVFNIKLDIKARRDSGVLIAAQGRKDFFVLELVNGDMRLTVENGRGPIIASFQPPKKFYFCDGQWHSIQAVKSKNVASLSVDNVFSEPKLGDHSSPSTDTSGALFLGGHKFLTTRAKGIATKLPFVGCVKNVYIGEEPIEILANMADGNVIVGTCPTD